MTFYQFSPEVRAKRKAFYDETDTPVIRQMKSELKSAADKEMGEHIPSIIDGGALAVSGDPHDYYSEGPYWWPDPDHPDGPYIRRDGQTNPNRRDKMKYLTRMTHMFYTLALAGFLLDEPSYTARADQVLRVWFLDKETYMYPNMVYAQAVPGICDGRGIGIIDTMGLSTLLIGLDFFSEADAYTDTLEGVRAWFASYLDWLLTSKNGIEESQHMNNHRVWYYTQVMSYATFCGRADIAKDCEARFRDDIIPRHMAADGSLPAELRRTNSYSYSYMCLNAFAIAAETAYQHGTDLWNFRLPDGRGIGLSFDYHYPYFLDPQTWPFQQISGKGTRHADMFALAAYRLGKDYAEGIRLRIAGRPYFVCSRSGSLFLVDGSPLLEKDFRPTDPNDPDNRNICKA